MSTTITIVDPFKGTVVLETNRDVKLQLNSNNTTLEVGGKPQELTTGEPGPTIIRTPEPVDQSMVVTEAGIELPQNPVHKASQEAAAAESLRKDREVLESASKPPKKPYVAKQSVEKVCAADGCDNVFTASGSGIGRAKFCPEHKTGAKGYKKAAAAPKQPSGPITANSPLPEGMWWCIHHQSQQPHRSPDCPLLNDGTIPSQQTELVKPAFDDPWDCGRCREDGHVCRFHRSMEASGQKPPTKL